MLWMQWRSYWHRWLLRRGVLITGLVQDCLGRPSRMLLLLTASGLTTATSGPLAGAAAGFVVRSVDANVAEDLSMLNAFAAGLCDEDREEADPPARTEGDRRVERGGGGEGLVTGGQLGIFAKKPAQPGKPMIAR